MHSRDASFLMPRCKSCGLLKASIAKTRSQYSFMHCWCQKIGTASAAPQQRWQILTFGRFGQPSAGEMRQVWGKKAREPDSQGLGKARGKGGKEVRRGRCRRRSSRVDRGAGGGGRGGGREGCGEGEQGGKWRGGRASSIKGAEARRVGRGRGAGGGGQQP